MHNVLIMNCVFVKLIKKNSAELDLIVENTYMRDGILLQNPLNTCLKYCVFGNTELTELFLSNGNLTATSNVVNIITNLKFHVIIGTASLCDLDLFKKPPPIISIPCHTSPLHYS